jgi:hypothetical protein
MRLAIGSQSPIWMLVGGILFLVAGVVCLAFLTWGLLT